MRRNARAALDIYGGVDPRDSPAYLIGDAARYLRVPAATLRAWSFGQRIKGRDQFVRVIPARHRSISMLSFKDLVGAHILSSLRGSGVTMQRVRTALSYLRRELDMQEPLVDAKFCTDGADIFVERVEGMVNASQRGQMALKPMLDAYLQRIEYDSSGVVRLFPFIRRREPAGSDVLASEPKFIVIDPQVAFGNPVISGTNIRTSMIADRYWAGESIQVLAEDYHRSVEEIEEAVRCESIAA